MPTISTLTVDLKSNTSRFRAGITGAIAGLGALAAGAGFAFKQFEDAEKLTAQTGAVLESTGRAAGVSAKHVDKLSQALMRKAAIDDEVIRNGENILLTFTEIRNEVGKGNDIFDRAVRLTTDLSVAMGQDMKTSAIQVGKALNDPVAGLTSLSRIGVKFTEDTKKQIEQLVKHGKTLEAQKLILGELATEFKGSAEAQATSSARIGVALGNLAEFVGGLLAPAIEFLLAKGTELVKFLQHNAVPILQSVGEWFTNVWNSIKPVAETVAGILVPAFQAAWHAIRDRVLPSLKSFLPILKLAGAAFVALATVIGVQVGIAITVISHVIAIIANIVDAFMVVVDWIRRNVAPPVVAAIGQWVQWIKTAILWVKDRLVGAWNAIKAPVLAVIHAFSSAIQTLIGWIKSAISWLSQLGSGVSSALAEAGVAGGVFGDVNVNAGGSSVGGGGKHGRSMPDIQGDFGGDVVLQIDGETFARISRAQLLRLKSSRANLGLA